MPRQRRPEQCVYKEAGRRCVRNGSGNPSLCQPHKIVFVDEARRAADPSNAARRAANGFRDIVEDLLNGKPFNKKKAASTITDFARDLGVGYAGVHRRDGGFEPPPGFHPPPNWQREEPPAPPAQNPQLEIEARRVLGFGPSEPLTEDVVKERRRVLARKHHPDRGGAVERMQSINDATDTLLSTL